MKTISKPSGMARLSFVASCRPAVRAPYGQRQTNQDYEIAAVTVKGRIIKGASKPFEPAARATELSLRRRRHKVVRAPARPGEQRTVRADIAQARSALAGSHGRHSKRALQKPCAEREASLLPMSRRVQQ